MKKCVNILVVEDETIIAMEIQDRLKRLGYNVSGVVTSGEEAIQKVNELAPGLVLMDIMLEGKMDGIQAAEHIRENFDIPVIYVTAYSDEDTLHRAKITEPYGYILKPLEERELHTVIEIVLYKHYMEKKVKEDARWFSTTLKSIGDGVITTDTQSRITFMNRIAEKLTGWTNQEVLGKKLTEVFRVFDEKSEKSIKNPAQRVIKEGMIIGPANHRILIDKRGRKIPINDSAAPIVNEKGKITGVVLTFSDITKSRRVERELQESAERFRSLVETSHTGIIIFNEHFHCIYANNKLVDILGYTKKEMIHKDCRRFIGESVMQFITEHEDGQRLESSMSNRQELEIVRKDGYTRDVELNISFFKDTKGNNHTVVQILDITDQKKLEEQLRQAQKMKAIGTLAGGVAHDFNNLLTAILGCTNMVMTKVDRKEPIYEDLKDIQVSAERAADLTRQLLLFSRNQPMKFVFMNLNKIIEDLLMMLHRLIGEDIFINTSLESNLWTIRVDKSTMGQVLMNLAVNARDAMPDGGKLTIKTENVILDESYCQTVPEAKIGNYVQLTVTDTGLGMSKETQERIFEPFFSTKGPGKGTGLGLSVVYGIVKQQGGWIHVYSEHNQGTSFKIYFPAVDEESENDPPPKRLIKGLKGHGEHILVVEDEKNVRDFVEKALLRNGYFVTTVNDAKEAMKVFKKNIKKYQMVFSDVVLPGKSGIQLIEEIIQNKANIKILLSSGYTDRKSQWPTIQEKGIPYLQKPFSTLGLLQAVHDTLMNA